MQEPASFFRPLLLVCKHRKPAAGCLYGLVAVTAVLVLLLVVTPDLSRAGQRHVRLGYHRVTHTREPFDIPAVHSAAWRPWLRNSGIRVSAIVFYGRRKYVKVLEKYLKRNTWHAGGVLDEVQWMVRTDDAQDLRWLNDVLIPSDPSYKKVEVQGAGFESHYRHLASDTFYVKFDGDIMFIKEKAIDAMLRENLLNRFWVVSANVINHSILTWVHAAMGAFEVPTSALSSSAQHHTDKKSSLLKENPFADMQYHIYDKCTVQSSMRSHCSI